MQNNEDTQVDPWIARNPEEDVQVEVNAIPNRGLQVEAASLALLREKGEGTIRDYQETMGRSPTESVKLIQSKMDQITGQMQEAYTASLIPILSDPNRPFEQKQAAVDSVTAGAAIPKDVHDSLASEALISENPGESLQGEEVRMTLADELQMINSQRKELQSIANSVSAKNQKHSQKMLDVLEMFLPAEAGIAAARVAKGLGGDNSAAAAFLLPGSARQKLADSIAKMPHQDRVEFAKQLATVVSESSGILLDSNQLRINQWLNDVILGEVQTEDVWMDNIFQVMDLVGLGAMVGGVGDLARRGRAMIAEGPRRAQAEQQARLARYEQRVEPTMEAAPARTVAEDAPLTGEAVAPTPKQSTNADRIAALEEELATNLADAGNVLDKGAVENLRKERAALLKSLKEGTLPSSELRKPGVATQALERRQDIQAQIARIDSQIDMNAAASQAAERVSALEKELASLRKQEPVEMDARLNPIVNAIRKEEMNSVYGTIAPRSAYSTMSVVNPGQARNIHSSILLGGDELAVPLSAATRNEVAVKAVSPQVASPTGVVSKVPVDMEAHIRSVFTGELGQAVKNTFGGLAFTEGELQRARAARVADYSTVAGMKINDATTSVGGSGNKLTFSAVYSNGETGWLRAEDAVEQAKASLRKQGVTDENIEILKSVGAELHPVKLEDVKGKNGEYFIRINMEDDLRAYDVKDWDSLDVKRNIFDFLETKGDNSWGSLNRHVFTPDATLHPTLVGGFSIADDKAARLSSAFTELFENLFSDPYMKLPKARRQAIDAYIKEANLKELKFDRTALLTRFSPAEVDVLEGWRRAWDHLWVFENLDVVRSLNRDGFTLFEHPNIRVVVREMEGAKKRYDRNVAYDPSTDTIRKLTEAEINDIYAKGGNVGEFRRPVNISGQDVENIIIRNKGNEVARKLKETDKILEYRDGYYQVFYKAPRFIDEIDSTGKRRTIGVTESAKEAKRLTEELSRQNPGKTYKHRGDERDITRSADSYWDMQHVGGRLAQRHRGQLLQGSVGTKQMGNVDLIETPADSAVRAAHSIGGRMAMRDTLEIAKQRFIAQYEDVLVKKDGVVQFPATRDDIKELGEGTNWRLADARTTWEHIRYMENGYISALDATVKNALNAMATAAGLKGYDTVEKVLRAGSDVNITGTVKGAVFGSMLATNPLRQFLVQPNQALRMLAYNPSGFLSWRVPGMVTEVLTKRVQTLLMKTQYSKNTQEFMDWFRETGMEQAITRGNLIRGTLLDASERSTLGGRVKDSTVGLARKVGYDQAETINLLIHSAFVFDRYKQSGRNIMDPIVREEMHSITRAATLNMNFAGDMPYNQNWAALLMTYMQVPHKFLLSPLNRQLSVADRTRLLMADLTFWGLPVAAIYEMLDKDLPVEDQWMRELLSDGLQSVMLNGMLNAISNEKQSVDWSSLAPFDMGSWYKHGENLMFDGGLAGMIANTPTARVLGLGADSRLGMAIKSTVGMFADIADVELDAIPPADILDAANSWLSISSGWSNFQKARAAWMLGEVRDKHGRLTDDDVTRLEAAMMAFGFGPQDVRKFYETQKLNTKGGAIKAEDDDMKQFNMLVVQHVNGDVKSEKAIKLYANMIASKGWIPDKRTHVEQLAKLKAAWDRTADSKVKETLFSQVIQLPGVDSTVDPIRNAPLSTADREKLERTFLDYRKRMEDLQAQAEKEKGNK